MVRLRELYEVLIRYISLIKSLHLIIPVLWESLHILILNDRDSPLMLLLVHSMLVLSRFTTWNQVLSSDPWLLDLIVLQELLFI